jgi:hypothetical protein
LNILPYPSEQSAALGSQAGYKTESAIADNSALTVAIAPGTDGQTDYQSMSYTDKLNIAIQMVPDLLEGDIKQLLQDPAFVAELVAVGLAFAALQATPAGPLIDGLMVVTLGVSAALSLGGFLYKSYTANDEASLRAAAEDLKNFIEIAGLAGAAKLIGMASRALKNLRGGATAVDAEAAARQILFDELTKAGVKFTPENIVKIARAQDGKVIFLETGSSKAGLQHIVERHGAEFAQKGISEAQIPEAVMSAVTRGKIVGHVGKTTSRPIYEVLFEGQERRIAVTTGSNGFIVGAQIFR